MITDIHCHILPGIDDGSASVQESLELLSIQAKQGFRRVIATPHFYAQHETLDHFLEKRTRAHEALLKAMEGRDDLPEILVGAEVYYFPGISDSDIIPALTIGNNRCILIEMPFCLWTETMFRELCSIQDKHGITPILAHIDRYIRPFHTHRLPERLQQQPVIVQANASFFLKKSTRSMALRMLKKDQIQLLASDAHNLVTRPPQLGDAVKVIEKHLGSGVFDRIRECEKLLFSEPSIPSL